jgi:hypothetical protein
MITVDQLEASHRFPAIDFKFVNRGNASAVLWKFALVIDELTLDPSPAIEARVRLQDAGPGSSRFSKRQGPARHLALCVTNQGWDAAHDCRLTLGGPILDRIFPEAARAWRVDIESGETKELLLSIDDADVVELERLARPLREAEREEFERTLRTQVANALARGRPLPRPSKSDADALSRYLSTPEGRAAYMKDPAIRERLTVHMEQEPAPVTDRETEARAEASLRAEFETRNARVVVPAGRMMLDYSAHDARRRLATGAVAPDMGGNIGGSILLGSDGFFHEEHFASFRASFPTPCTPASWMPTKAPTSKTTPSRASSHRATPSIFRSW